MTSDFWWGIFIGFIPSAAVGFIIGYLLHGEDNEEEKVYDFKVKGVGGQ